MKSHKITRGIILAGGKGTRFDPFTRYTSKHLLPINDKPIVYYPISNFIKNGINKILIISDKKNIEDYRRLLGSGRDIGVSFTYKAQNKPRGLPEALILGEKFSKNKPFALNLGDHILFGKDIDAILKKNLNHNNLNTIFTIKHTKTKDYGVLEKDPNGQYKIVEKPKKTSFRDIVVGIYIYNKDAIKIAKKLKPSKRKELEITELNNILIKKKKIKIIKFNNIKNFWFDAGDANKVSKISSIISNYEKKNKIQIANLNEIALLKKLINKKTFLKTIKNKKSSYFDYLRKKYENNKNKN